MKEWIAIKYSGITSLQVLRERQREKERRVFLYILGTKFILPDNRSHVRIDEVSSQDSSYAVNDILQQKDSLYILFTQFQSKSSESLILINR